ncbi:MAG: DUF4142 domain-containing protein [Burkholderiaceae bacterium]
MNADSRRPLLPLVAAAAAIFSISACSDRTNRATGSTTAVVTTPNPPTNTAAPPADAAPSSASSSGATMAAADREFFILASSGDMLEIESGRLALDKSQNANVRSFAQKMVDDHTRAGEDLRQAATSAGMAPPTAMSPPHSVHLERLRGLAGAEFDREYAAQIGVAAHQEAVALFERALREAANPDVRALAEKGVSGKREHLELAQTLAKTVGVGADRLKLAMAPPDLSSLSAAIATRPNTAGATTTSAAPSASDASPSATVTPARSSSATTATDSSSAATPTSK